MAKGSATMLAWDHWHIEASSICALRCPRCPRVEAAESLLNQQLSLEFFKTQIGSETIKQIRKITFCGNDGDPVYCKDLIEICQWIKQVNSDIQLVIVTNGSYRSAEWWKQLAEVLDLHDEVNWSLDGWDQVSNEKYRINSDWNSIEQGIKTFFAHNQTSYRVWAAIAFRFNQDHIQQQQQIAADLGFDCYQLTKSTKFGSKYPAAYGPKDMLEPTDTSLVAAEHRFERQLYTLSGRTRPGKELKVLFLQRATQVQQAAQYSGICLIGNKGVFLNSRGEFFPCCWTANRYPHNDQWLHQAQEKFNLNIRPFAEIINDPFWSGDFLKFNSLECTIKCTATRLSDVEHTTEW
jgi:MoaA/NifB/PqqE/SkfB family radical SAM enzyme